MKSKIPPIYYSLFHFQILNLISLCFLFLNEIVSDDSLFVFAEECLSTFPPLNFSILKEKRKER